VLTASKRSLNRKSKAGPLKLKSTAKQIYFFASKKAEGSSSDKALLGGKGANLHEMTKLGLPVPPGFTITTDVCKQYYKLGQKFPETLEAEMRSTLRILERETGKVFGSDVNPLLVSVRSGAQASMPGMMDTILNLGLNEKVLPGLALSSRNPRFAYDSYRRFISMYSDVVLDIHSNLFETELEHFKFQKKYSSDNEFTVEDLKLLCQKFKRLVKNHGKEFPEDPWEQLIGAVKAVFRSWMNPRAITYRRLNHIPESWGTAVTVQSMVFGNLGDDCATGVCFTRDPATGERKFFGEYLKNAQGEDVVSGVRTPQPINEFSRSSETKGLPTLEKEMPKAYKELVVLYKKLESHYRDMQDIEFTIERGKLYMLQTRNGKRSIQAGLKIARDLHQEKLISEKEALLRIDPLQIDQLLHPRLDPKAKKEVIAKGLPASPGAASGSIVFDPDTAEVWAKDRKVLLVRVETSPEDIHGMSVAEGILTARGGMTSHAAVVARGMGKPCVAGCAALKIDEKTKTAFFGDRAFKEGDLLTIDGATGEVIFGSVPTLPSAINDDFKWYLKLVEKYQSMAVRANADTPNDAKIAREFGAKGIGLCRTEHMFFEADRIDAVREMILAETKDAREKALAKILPMQKSDFKGIFKEMAGLPVTIRLLDPPLHEFIPAKESELKALALRLKISFEKIARKAETLHEFNPMLGHRGCRLAISFPEIYITQVRAIIMAACELKIESNLTVIPEIMIPLIGDPKELKLVADICQREAENVIGQFKVSHKNLKLTYKLGTMIELPRAALMAGELAQDAEFFSFGTNDLTQTTYGLSRDDSGGFLKDYLDAKIYERDPFARLDNSGVGRLMKIATTEGRAMRADLKVGICGEHAGDPESIALCYSLNLDYVSCSPYRVPVARIASAQAQVRSELEKSSKKLKQ